MGVVYEVHDGELDRRVAAKVLPQVTPATLRRFKREFRSLASIAHPNLVGLYELLSDGERWFFTMELVDGVDLLEWASPGRAIGEALSDEDVARLRRALPQVAEGLSAIHATNRLHRDLKPSNVMVRRDGSVAILDFGLVTELRSDAGLDAGAGTIRYMAPEQWRGDPLSEASDWYALGTMLYEALAGRPPFEGRGSEVLIAKMTGTPTPPSAIAANVPPDLDRLCVDLLAADPAERPTGPEVLERLEPAACAGTEAPEPGMVPEPERLVGRENDLRLLREALAATTSGRATVVHVYGRSGVGKSVLVERFLDEVVSAIDEPVVLTGRCFEQESVPYKALDDLIDALADHLSELGPAESARLVPDEAAILARVFPVLRRVEAIGGPGHSEPEIPDRQELRRRAFAALRELLSRIAARRPLVLHIDDLQWGDVDSALLLDELLQPPAPPALLLLLSYRSEYVERSACLAVLRRVESSGPESATRFDLPLTSLSKKESHDLALRLMAARDPGTLALAERVAVESGGNPYFITEFVQFLRALPEDVDASSYGVLELDSVLRHRVGRLPEQARALLEIVAVAGKPLRLRDAYEAAPEREALQPAVTLLRAEGFIRGTGPSLTDDIETFHDRVREAVLAGLAPATLQGHHAALARALEATGESDPETVGLHFEGAGVPAKARRYFAIAAGHADRTLAFDRAAGLYRRALDLHDPRDAEVPDLRTALARSLANSGRGFEAAKVYEKASRDHRGDRRDELEGEAAKQYCTSGHMSEGRRIFRTLLEQEGLKLPSNPVLTLASLLVRRIRLRMRGIGFTERAEEEVAEEELRRIDLLWSVALGLSVPDAVAVASLQTEGLIMALEAGEPHRLARALAFEAFLTGAAGWKAADRSAHLLERARELAERIEDPYALGMVGLAGGMIALNQARFEDAIADSEAAEALFRTHCSGVWWEVATVRTVVAWCHWHTGRCRELRLRTAAYLNEARDRGDLFTITNLGAVASPHLSLVADDPDLAQHQVDEAIVAWGLDGFHLQHVAAIFTRAHIQMYRGNGLAALDHVQSQWPALRRALQLQTQIVRIMFLDLRARAALEAATRARSSGRLLRRAERDARRMKRERTHWGDAFAASILAGTAATRGRHAKAVEHLRSAIGKLDEIGYVLRGAAARMRAGALLGGSEGDTLVEAGRAAMRAEEVVDPDRMAALYVPGRFPD